MSEQLVFEGTAKYARVFERNRDMGSQPGDKYDYPEATTIEMIVDQETLGEIVKQWPDAKPRFTEDGIQLKLRRVWHNPRRPDRGGPPVVKDSDGNEWDSSVNIGNGSKVRVAAEIYHSKHGTHARLQGVQVLDLVEWEGGESDDGPAPDLPF